MERMTSEEIATKLAGDLLGLVTDEVAWSEPIGAKTAFIYNRRSAEDVSLLYRSLKPFTDKLDWSVCHTAFLCYPRLRITSDLKWRWYWPKRAANRRAL
jgi:hypothetical protein